jgi:hypothetical protein
MLAHFRPTSSVFALRLDVFRSFYCNTGQRTCPRQVKLRLPIFARRRPFPCFRPSLAAFKRSAVTQGNVRGRVKLSDPCPFSLDVAHFHIFALCLAIFRSFRCNTGQRMCPRQVKRRLPVFAERRSFPRFRPSLSRFQAFPL